MAYVYCSCPKGDHKAGFKSSNSSKASKSESEGINTTRFVSFQNLRKKNMDFGSKGGEN